MVLYAPGDTVGSAFPDPASPAWTKDGRAIPSGPIPVGNVTGPVLAVAGGEDNLWSSTPQARGIQARLRADAAKATVELLTYPAAGHGVATYPFQPAGVMGVHPVDGRTYRHGGTRAANAAARRVSWSRVLAFLTAPS